MSGDKNDFLLYIAVTIVLSLAVLLVYSCTTAGQIQNDIDLVEALIYEPDDSFNPYYCPDCNIIIISVDTLRADHLPCYGYSRDTMPNVCRFALDAVLYENAYSQAPATVPALRTVMSGSMISNSDKESLLAHYESTPFLAEILKKKGYYNIGFTDHHGLGSINKTEGYESKEAGVLIRGFDEFFYYGKGHVNATSHILTEQVLAWLEKGHEGKFFLWVHYFDPHFNYNPLPEYEGMFGFVAEDCGRVHNWMDISEIRKIEKNMTEIEVQCLLDLYDAEIFYTDEYIGKLVDKIEESGLFENTLLIFTADHGEEFLERTRIGHERTVYNELIKVPLIIRSPRSVTKRVKDNIATKDIFNIVLGMETNELYLDDEVYSRAYHINKKKIVRPNEFSLMFDDKKIILTPDTDDPEHYKLELFDLAEDPGETESLNNSLDVGKYADKLVHWIIDNKIAEQNASAEALRIEEETNERLRSLGYLV